MQLDVKLQEPFSYSILGVIGLVVLIVALITYIIIKLVNKKKKKEITPRFNIENIHVIKNKYISNIDLIKEKFEDNKISERRAYNELSSLIRSFIYEATNIDVRKYTLSDIRKIKMNNLTKLVEEYYEPEFSKEGKGEILSSIDKTKEVIIKWK